MSSIADTKNSIVVKSADDHDPSIPPLRADISHPLALDVESLSSSTSVAPPDPQQRSLQSISQIAEGAAGGWTAPRVFQWIEVVFRMPEPSSHSGSTQVVVKEATGWAMDSAARGPLNQIGSYIGSAILLMATKDAGCTTPSTCYIVGTLKPSSLLTLTSSVVGVLAAFILPISGAIVDHTPHRKMVAVVAGFVAVLATGLQIGISAQRLNWLYILVLDALQTFALLVHTTAVFAYLPELTVHQENLPAYTAHFNVRQYVSQFTLGGFLALAGATWASSRPNRTAVQASVDVARLSAAIAFAYGCLFGGYAWTYLFRARPALSKVPEGSNLLTVGFRQVYQTTRKIGRDYRALRWFLFSLLWSPEAGAGVVLSIAVTFLVSVMQFSTFDIAKVSLILMTGNIAGSYFSSFINNRCNWFHPLHSYRLALTLLGLSVAVSASYLDGPAKRPAVYGFASSWGFFMGWTYPAQRVLFVTLIPKGQEMELMGCFFFAGQILGWLPPLIFTILNQRGVSMQLSFGLVAGFCWVAVLSTLPMGSYQVATDLVARDSQEKLRYVSEAARDQQNYSSLSYGRRNPVNLQGKDVLEEKAAMSGLPLVTT